MHGVMSPGEFHNNIRPDELSPRLASGSGADRRPAAGRRPALARRREADCPGGRQLGVSRFAFAQSRQRCARRRRQAGEAWLRGGRPRRPADAPDRPDAARVPQPPAARERRALLLRRSRHATERHQLPADDRCRYRRRGGRAAEQPQRQSGPRDHGREQDPAQPDLPRRLPQQPVYPPLSFGGRRPGARRGAVRYADLVRDPTRKRRGRRRRRAWRLHAASAQPDGGSQPADRADAEAPCERREAGFRRSAGALDGRQPRGRFLFRRGRRGGSRPSGCGAWRSGEFRVEFLGQHPGQRQPGRLSCLPGEIPAGPVRVSRRRALASPGGAEVARAPGSGSRCRYEQALSRLSRMPRDGRGSRRRLPDGRVDARDRQRRRRAAAPPGDDPAPACRRPS